LPSMPNHSSAHLLHLWLLTTTSLFSIILLYLSQGSGCVTAQAGLELLGSRLSLLISHPAFISVIFSGMDPPPIITPCRFSQVAVWLNSTFLVTSAEQFAGQRCCGLFNSSPTEGHLSRFGRYE
jgi:hypothetical protein